MLTTSPQEMKGPSACVSQGHSELGPTGQTPEANPIQNGIKTFKYPKAPEREPSKQPQ